MVVDVEGQLGKVGEGNVQQSAVRCQGKDGIVSVLHLRGVAEWSVVERVLSKKATA
jgi:hypothetical protein